MKTNLLIMLCAICACVFFSGCQKDDLVQTQSSNELLRPRALGLTYSPGSTICLGDEVTVCFDNGLNSSCGQSSIQIWKPEDADWDENVVLNATPTAGVVCYTFTPDSEGEYNFRGRWQRGGAASGICAGHPSTVNNIEASEPLTVEVCGCETLLTGSGSCNGNDRTATYVFTNDGEIGYVKIQGGLTNFSGDAQVFINGTEVDFNSVSGDGWDTGVVGDYTVGQRTPGMSSNRNVRVEGPASCEELVITLNWSTTAPKGASGEITGSWSAADEDGVILSTVSDIICPE